MIFDLYKLNINNYPTLPSLAFAIYRSKYMKDKTIPLICGQPFHDMKNSYTGGSVDMIIPHGFNLYHYDINSLYPYAMLTYDVPIGNMKSFTGDVWKLDPIAFGFFEAEVIAPLDLDIPVLQIHLNNRTVSPVGKFKGWFFSEELRNAIDNYDYKVEIIKGYTFDKANIFRDYVNDLYNLRLQFNKNHPMNYITKILMNSLYGRFGLNPLLPETLIIDKNELDDFVDHSEINELIDLDTKYLIQFLDNKKVDSFLNGSSLEDVKSNIAIASAITSYSRIHLNEIKKYCFDNNNLPSTGNPFDESSRLSDIDNDNFI
jgi:DNA polymerase type B, organellar and viral